MPRSARLGKFLEEDPSREKTGEDDRDEDGTAERLGGAVGAAGKPERAARFWTLSSPGGAITWLTGRTQVSDFLLRICVSLTFLRVS